MQGASTDLATFIRTSGPLPPANAVQLVRQIAAASEAARASGTEQVELTTSTIMLAPDGTAHLVSSGHPPSSNQPSDVAALASVLYETLTGAAPSAGVRPGLPPALEDVIAKGLGSQPGAGYRSVGEFARAAEFAVMSGPTSPGVASAPPAQFGPAVTGSYSPPVLHAQGKRRRWLPIAAALMAVVAVIAGLGIWKLTAGKSGVDLSKLDVGKYSTTPQSITGTPTESEARRLEAYRLAEGIVNPYDLNPALVHIRKFAVPDAKTAAAVVSGNGNSVVQPVLERYGMITGYAVQGLRTEDPAKSGQLMVVMLTSFPNDAEAAKAATEMDAVDLNYNPENRSIAIPGYPQAKAHYRPGQPSMAATMASGSVVISVAVVDTTVDPNVFTSEIQQVFDKQVPLLADLSPLNELNPALLQRDPDNMVSRLVVTSDEPVETRFYGTLGARGSRLCLTSALALEQQLAEKFKLDRCAFSDDGRLLRLESPDAVSHLDQFIESDQDDYDHEIGAPAGVPDTRCFEQKRELWSKPDGGPRFICALAYDRYLALVFADDEQDLKRRTAAQYALLVNSA